MGSPMSETLTSQVHATWRLLRGNAFTVRRETLLRAAARGDRVAISQICDRHGAALFHLACAVVADPVRAEAVVVEVVARACVDPAATATAARGSLRRELARLTYLCSSRDRLEQDLPQTGSAVDRMVRLGEAARQQRTAIALVQCGDHTVDDVADLLGLPFPTVAVLLTSGLRDLEAADRRPAGGTIQRHERRP